MDPGRDELSDVHIWTRTKGDLDNPKRLKVPTKGATHAGGEDITAIYLDDNYDALVDVDDNNGSTGNLAFLSDDFPVSNQGLGGEISLVGYPKGFYDTKTAYPTKQGLSIATVYGIEFQNQPCFLTYGRTYGGTSGAPVVRFSISGWGNPIRRNLLGVHFEGYVPPTSRPLSELEHIAESEECQNNDNRDDFNKALYPETITETIDQL